MTDLPQLRSRYLELTNQTPPQLAKQRGFPVRDNHCFQRIILDNLLGQCWYDVLDRGKTPAYKQLTAAQLQEAIALAEAILTHPTSYLEQLNQNSLNWRSTGRST
ncbi:hypothetical protein [Leptolyngbya ohadii]|uniref:hypothetical protein n=1 Tax=Leptolyngbya ohadii TaxID=1962290 RepID=UPI000B5A1E37|nr:hypothetical protein [Leptolyngbya ohadii]